MIQKSSDKYFCMSMYYIFANADKENL